MKGFKQELAALERLFSDILGQGMYEKKLLTVDWFSGRMGRHLWAVYFGGMKYEREWSIELISACEVFLSLYRNGRDSQEFEDAEFAIREFFS